MKRKTKEDTIWTNEFAKEMQRRAKEIESGKVKGISWTEVKRKAKAVLKKKR